MFTLTYFLLLVTFSTFTPNQVTADSVDARTKEVFISFFKQHRLNAGLNSLTWSEHEEQVANLTKSLYCSFGTISSLTAMTLYVSDNNLSSPASETASWLLNMLYNRSTTTYIFGGGNNSLKFCNKSSKSSNVDQFDVYSQWLAIWMRPDVSSFGCVYGECPKQKPPRLFFCNFHPFSFEYEPMLRNENFLKLCQSESGRWRSCDDKLQKMCLMEDMEKNINSTDPENDGDWTHTPGKVIPELIASFVLSVYNKKNDFIF